MSYYIGIDKSDCTTSAPTLKNKINLIYQQNFILSIKNGTLALRRSDTVFSHVKLPLLRGEL